PARLGTHLAPPCCPTRRSSDLLRIEWAEKAVLEERERIASNLHDGMAQSLFLLSIKVRQLDQLDVSREDRELFEELNQTIHHIQDRKSTRLNSSHVSISYAVFC